MDIETLSEKWMEEEVESVYREVDDSWRHGSYIYEVFKDPETDRYWAVTYQKTGDGEYNSLREAECGDPVEVFPKNIIVESVVYETRRD